MEILLNKVSYIYDEGMSYEKHALAGVDVEVKQGEFIGVVGKTGSGKSTLVKMFNALLKPSYGGVYVDGQDIHDRDYPRHELRGRVGMVFQYPEQQLFEASVVKDVQFGPRNQGLDDLQVELRAFEALKSVGIGEELLDVSPLALSGGQKRRVAIAGVLAMQPEVLVLDEPTAGLDKAGQASVFRLLHQLNEEKGITIILISHRMEDVAEHTKRVWVMHDGRLVIDDTPEAVFARVRELEELGLKAPVVTYLMEGLRARGVPVPQGVLTREQAVAAIRGLRVR
ncbi:MAG: energy-coupling factor transporter ATPase [Eubacterium sp.]|nr:energy-coupling factor transporter ATPase [Eubacterium sp.]